MQTAKTRNTSGGSSDVPQRTSPATPRSTRVSKSGRNDSTESSMVTPTKSGGPTDPNPKTTDRRSPRSPAREKKRSGRVAELEAQIANLKEEVKKGKEQMITVENGKKKAQQEAEEAKKQLSAISAKLEESQHQLADFSAAEESRLQELRNISQERDKAWQSELEVMQKQHSIDSAEIERLREQLDRSTESEAAQSKLYQDAKSEFQAVKEYIEKRDEKIEILKNQIREIEKSEIEARELSDERQEQLEIAKTAIERLQESICFKDSELEETKAQVKSLEETVRKLHASKLVEVEEADAGKILRESELQSEIERLRLALESAEIKYQSAFELVESVKTEWGLKVSELEFEIRNKNAEIAELMKKQESEMIPENSGIQVELETKLMKSITDVAELKANLMDKETELQNLLEENESLKSEISKQETEIKKNYEKTLAELELAKAAEQDVRMRLNYVTEEADKSSRRAARVAEQLDAAQAVNSEMEAELRRLRVQSDQWRKAAEAAAAALTGGGGGGGNNGRLIERSGSLDCEYNNSIGGKMMNSPFSDDLDFESPKKKNGGVLRRMSGLWKKSPK